MTRNPLHTLPTSLLLFMAVKAYGSLPYNPTNLFSYQQAGSNPNYYLLEPPSTSSPSGRLSSISDASAIVNTEIPLNAIAGTLPFLKEDASTPYTAVLRSDNTLAVYAGDCQASPTDSQLWLYPLSKGSAGAWSQQTLNSATSSNSDSTSGAQYLASAIPFSYTTNDVEDIYMFGGMCPTANATTGTWTSDATYSNELSMLSVDGSKYSLTAETGAATAEAGFTITPLLPTYANQSDGSQTRQQDFILIGGHTQEAFIGMGTIALFSLPQSSWSFLPVNGPTRTDSKTKRQVSGVDSRSGHTAVLTEDGSKVIIFGGWVGDITNAAQPQLLILGVGEGYGGTTDWTWDTSDMGSPFSSGAGIYGHGAAMLPDNVMLVTGGYSIQSSSAKQKRAAQPSNLKNYLLNVTSGQWIDSYDTTSRVGHTTSMDHAGGVLHTESQKAGLGVGLTVGLIAVICIIVFAVLYYRKLKKQRLQHQADLWADTHHDQDREKEIEDLINVTQSYDPVPPVPPGHGPRGGGEDASMPHAGISHVRPNVYSGAERSGLCVDVPSPHRGLRKSMQGRGQYSVAPRWDDGSFQYSGNMQAISERDEESSNAASSRRTSAASPRIGLTVDTAKANSLDPFRDPDPPAQRLPTRKPVPPLPTDIRSPPPASKQPLSVEDRRREMQEWRRDWEAAATSPTSVKTGRYSPTKSGRTSPSKSSDRTRSDLSERSMRSNNSAFELIPSRGPSSRSAMRNYLPSIIPAALTNPFANPQISPTYSDGFGSSSASQGSDRSSSFTTANTTITQLQAESETLLGQGQGRPRGNSSSRPRRAEPRRPGTANSQASHATTHVPRSPGNQTHFRQTGTSDLLIPDTEPTFRLPRSRASPHEQRPPPSRGRQVAARQPSFAATFVGSVKRNVGRALTGGRTVSLTNDVAGRYGGGRVIGGDGYYAYTDTPFTTAPPSSGAGQGQGQQRDLGGLVDLSIPTSHLTGSTKADAEAALRRDVVRRSVSESAAFWQTKKGARDWDVEPIPSAVNSANRALVPSKMPHPQGVVGAKGGSKSTPHLPNSSAASLGLNPPTLPGTGWQTAESGRSTAGSNATGGSARTGESEGEWDVERAVEGRVVQVMFTVPRERLRVVNADLDADDAGSVEEREGVTASAKAWEKVKEG